jgi:predicted nucleic-acid-binding protein
MIGLDTNVLVRYLAQDEATQSARASTLIDGLTVDEPGFIALVTLVEIVWVMQSCYDAGKEEVVAILDTLLRTQTLLVENTETVLKAVRAFSRTSADFADCLIACSNHHAGCTKTVTFDTRAARSAGMELVP